MAADYLSGGEQQMVAVARAMSGNVKLLLLDEPFEGLAPAVILELFGVFDRLRRHTSIVIVEHNLDLVLALADRVFALERGAVFHTGPAAPLLSDIAYRKANPVAVRAKERRSQLRWHCSDSHRHRNPVRLRNPRERPWPLPLRLPRRLRRFADLT